MVCWLGRMNGGSVDVENRERGKRVGLGGLVGMISP